MDGLSTPADQLNSNGIGVLQSVVVTEAEIPENVTTAADPAVEASQETEPMLPPPAAVPDVQHEQKFEIRKLCGLLTEKLTCKWGPNMVEVEMVSPRCPIGAWLLFSLGMVTLLAVLSALVFLLMYVKNVLVYHSGLEHMDFYFPVFGGTMALTTVISVLSFMFGRPYYIKTTISQNGEMCYVKRKLMSTATAREPIANFLGAVAIRGKTRTSNAPNSLHLERPDAGCGGWKNLTMYVAREDKLMTTFSALATHINTVMMYGTAAQQQQPQQQQQGNVVPTQELQESDNVVAAAVVHQHGQVMLQHGLFPPQQPQFSYPTLVDDQQPHTQPVAGLPLHQPAAPSYPHVNTAT
eukprot:TRINITY_DN66083_c6_g3_i1.p1 TRINITY_DN66083_c6_g3~~TRINITY_DN66083_c6_g3_i1.p1  ORF type:complete len:352 (+),score=47.37 TRINITY_DN66083_c6_g3_i1:47-1102(+)